MKRNINRFVAERVIPYKVQLDSNRGKVLEFFNRDEGKIDLLHRDCPGTVPVQDANCSLILPLFYRHRSATVPFGTLLYPYCSIWDRQLFRLGHF
ncbi:hypothetical protein BH11BAC7_BH11BAC7_21790 [soil metagenome]